MAHFAETSKLLKVKKIAIRSQTQLVQTVGELADVCMMILPSSKSVNDYRTPLQNIGELVANVANQLGPEATLVTVGEVVDLVQVQAAALSAVRYQHWIVIKQRAPIERNKRSLPSHHFGALIQTRYKRSLRHVKTRIKYTYCPACGKTTKDYGGKKHTYHHYGTLMSDVWRDIACELDGDISEIITRFQDLFGLMPYKELLVLDCRQMSFNRIAVCYDSHSDWNDSFVLDREQTSDFQAKPAQTLQASLFQHPSSWKMENNTSTDGKRPNRLINQILQGDCLEWLREIPDNSVDFVFTDPPYNLGKDYTGYSDDLEIRKYFDWCDLWISELARVLQPGRTLALLNIPLWSVRHFLFLNTLLRFQNWIAWDALAYPVRLIMPAHYTILTFTKGQPRELPGLIGETAQTPASGTPQAFRSLTPLAEDFCLRSNCVKKRHLEDVDDRGTLSDLWWDIHRLKHNSRRVDHPTQLPPHLMYRLISIFTRPGEIVLDCFNGAGTTTLAAHQLERRYIGIENSQNYCALARSRHEEVNRGINPFRKAKRKLTAKNSPVPRMPKRKYEISKKTLQLEVKRVANELGHLPSREELVQYGKYPIEYYDEYFVSWGEVCAAARTTGMSELPPEVDRTRPAGDAPVQLRLDIENVD